MNFFSNTFPPKLEDNCWFDVTLREINVDFSFVAFISLSHHRHEHSLFLIDIQNKSKHPNKSDFARTHQTNPIFIIERQIFMNSQFQIIDQSVHFQLTHENIFHHNEVLVN